MKDMIVSILSGCQIWGPNRTTETFFSQPLPPISSNFRLERPNFRSGTPILLCVHDRAILCVQDREVLGVEDREVLCVEDREVSVFPTQHLSEKFPWYPAYTNFF